MKCDCEQFMLISHFGGLYLKKNLFKRSVFFFSRPDCIIQRNLKCWDSLRFWIAGLFLLSEELLSLSFFLEKQTTLTQEAPRNGEWNLIVKARVFKGYSESWIQEISKWKNLCITTAAEQWTQLRYLVL